GDARARPRRRARGECAVRRARRGAVARGARAPRGRGLSLHRLRHRFRGSSARSEAPPVKPKKILALIPARMGSSRFPGKPMARIANVPMIEHVYRRVALSRNLTATVVATCDEEIALHVRGIGGRVAMTGSHHERASDRCAEALAIVEKEDGVRFDIVVMVQGDEPLVYPEMIDEAVGPLLADPTVRITNLLGRISGDEEFEDRNCIKVVIDRAGNALYFSREPIPTRSKGT